MDEKELTQALDYFFPDIEIAATRVRRKGRAEAAFWRSAVSLPAEAARTADRPAGIGPTIDATLPIGMETALSMARLGAEVNACGGTPIKRASALLALPITSTNVADVPILYPFFEMPVRSARTSTETACASPTETAWTPDIRPGGRERSRPT